jgi:hypothetical protein
MAHYLTIEEGAKLKQVLRRYGCVTYGEVAAKVVEGGFYSKKTTVKMTLTRAFTGHRSLPEQLVKGLLALCKDDVDIAFINTQNNLNDLRMNGEEWGALLEGYVLRLKRVYGATGNNFKKLDILTGLEEVIQKFEAN